MVFFAIPIPEVIQCYRLLWYVSDAYELISWSFWCVFWVFVCFLWFLVFVVCFLFCTVTAQLCSDPISSLLYAHCRHDWCCHCINSVNLQMQLSGLNWAIWRWTEKMLHWGRSLKEMQNGLRTTGIGYNTVKMRVMCMFLELKLICNEVFWSANEFGNEFGVDDFWTRSTLFFKHMHAFSTTTLTGFVFCMGLLAGEALVSAVLCRFSLTNRVWRVCFCGGSLLPCCLALVIPILLLQASFFFSVVWSW